MFLRLFIAGTIALLASPQNLFADPESPPRKRWTRAMSTDRPDRTESAYSVEPGYMQIEMDFANFTRAKTKEQRASTWNVAPMNVKYGMLENADIQFVFDNYIEDRSTDLSRSEQTRTSGVGDFTTRVKVNLWGNDEGSTALAVMPFIKFPTNTNSLGNTSIEGGFIVPFAWLFADNWSLGVMTELDILRDADDVGNHASFINTITIAHDFNYDWGGYIEYYTELSQEEGAPFVATFDFGATYAISDDIQLDAGMNLGVTNSAPDIQPFIGVSFRFEPWRLFCDCL